jgi:putative transposase
MCGMVSPRGQAPGTPNAARFRLGEEGARSVRLPKLGTIAIRECTRKLRRMLDKGRAKIWFATVSQRAFGHWRVTINVEAAAFHPQQRHEPNQPPRVVGIDRGLATFLPSWPIERARSSSGSKALGRCARRYPDLRNDFVHRESTRLAKTHGHLVIEKLCTSGLIRSRLSRAIADSAWSLFASLLSYKASWYGAVLTVADRFYPSTRRCSACGVTGAELPLSERTFRCSSCGHEADRDTNAAACLAQYPEYWRPAIGLTSPRSTRRRKTSVEKVALTHDHC